MKDKEVKVGQVYITGNNDIFAITKVDESGHTYYTAREGWNGSSVTRYKEFDSDKLIAWYPTWQEAVNSKEFKGE